MSEPNYQTTKAFSDNLLANEMKKTKMLINKPVYSGLSISQTSKIAMLLFWYDYAKRKCREKSKLCYMDKNSFIYNLHKKGRHLCRC